MEINQIFSNKICRKSFWILFLIFNNEIKDPRSIRLETAIANNTWEEQMVLLRSAINLLILYVF